MNHMRISRAAGRLYKELQAEGVPKPTIGLIVADYARAAIRGDIEAPSKEQCKEWELEARIEELERELEWARADETERTWTIKS